MFPTLRLASFRFLHYGLPHSVANSKILAFAHRPNGVEYRVSTVIARSKTSYYTGTFGVTTLDGGQCSLQGLGGSSA